MFYRRRLLSIVLLFPLLLVALAGGFMLFSALATTFIVNIAFDWKLGFFVPLALIWHIFVLRKARDWGQMMDIQGLPSWPG